MGDIGGLVGLGGGAAGTGFAAPEGANLRNPVTQEQLNQAYSGVQGGLSSQDQLLAALQAQNGLQNQSNVYNQLQGVVAGTGPNPAQAMLSNATGQNVANQAALMAGQRGASANVGLMARQAAQQGAGIQQQAVGQGAALQAQQSLNALNGAGNIAGNQVSNQVGQTNANTQARLAEQANLLGAQGQFNQAAVGSQTSVNAGNTQLAGTTMQGQQGLIGGVMNGLGGLFADGGEVDPSPNLDQSAYSNPVAFGNQPQSKFGQFLSTMSGGAGGMGASVAQQGAPGSSALKGGASSLVGVLGKAISGGGGGDAGTPMAGGPMDAGSMGSDVMFAASGGKVNDYRTGGNVNAANKSQKAVKQGNSYANDKVPAVLSEGEVVLPRSVMQSKDPVSASARFVQAVLAKKGMRK